MKTFTILTIFTGFILLGSFSSSIWTEESPIPTDQIGNKIVEEQADVPILLARVNKPQHEPMASGQFEGGGGNCMSKFRDYYNSVRNPFGSSSDSLPLTPLVRPPRGGACEDCLNKYADWNRAWAVASGACAPACCP